MSIMIEPLVNVSVLCPLDLEATEIKINKDVTEMNERLTTRPGRNLCIEKMMSVVSTT